MKKSQYQYAIQLEARIEQLKMFYIYLSEILNSANANKSGIFVQSTLKFFGSEAVNPNQFIIESIKCDIKEDKHNILKLVDDYIKQLQAEYANLFEPDEDSEQKQ